MKGYRSSNKLCGSPRRKLTEQHTFDTLSATHHRDEALPVAIAARLRFRFLKVDLPIRFRSAASYKAKFQTMSTNITCKPHDHARQQTEGLQP